MTISTSGDTLVYQDLSGQRMEAQGVVVLGPSGGVKDSTGAVIYPDSMRTSAVTRDASGNLLTMTKTDGTNTWVYTITRDANGYFASDTLWVRQ